MGRKLCLRCKERPAKYRRPNGAYATDNHHDLCPQCWRRAFDSERGQQAPPVDRSTETMTQPQTTQNGQIVPRNKETDPATNLRNLIGRMEKHIANALPRHITPQRIMRVAMTAITKTPNLGRCTPGSFMVCLLTAAQLGLEPNTPLGQGYLIPRWNKSLNGYECTWQTGYQGLIDLAYRSGMVTGIRAHVVREGDHFEWEEGLDQKLVHRPSDAPDRYNRAITHAYGVVRIRDAEPHIEVLNFAQIEHRRLMNDAEKGGKFSPWKNHYEAMARKVACSAALKFCPKSAEMARADLLEQHSVGHATLVDVADEKLADALASEGVELSPAALEPASSPGDEGTVDQETGEVQAPTASDSQSGQGNGRRRRHQRADNEQREPGED